MLAATPKQQPQSGKMTFLNSSVLLGLLALLLVNLATPRLAVVLQVAASEHQSPSTNSNSNKSANSAAANSSTNPHWRRPGCHRVGHTRTISIPGCVKFNLSTNACRGYCMSYSIPANEDHSPLAHTEFDREDAHSPAGLSTPSLGVAGGKGAPLLMSRPSSTLFATEQQPQQRRPELEQLQSEPASSGASNNNGDAAGERPESRGNEAGSLAQRLSKAAAATAEAGQPERLLVGGQERSSSREQQQQQPRHSIGLLQSGTTLELSSGAGLLEGGGPKSAQAPAGAGGGGQQGPNSIYSAQAADFEGFERRDVVSISQCCNMMETEDVLVNLRCGANEIRRLVFKSAKTCECFFCKHV